MTMTHCNDKYLCHPVDKCSLPYYGGCQFTRLCFSDEGDTVICGQCLAGFITNTITSNAGPCPGKLITQTTCHMPL